MIGSFASVADKAALTEGLAKIGGIYEIIPPDQLIRSHSAVRGARVRSLLCQPYTAFPEYSEPQNPSGSMGNFLGGSAHFAGRPILFVAEGYSLPG